jgi:hypothetical protein
MAYTESIEILFCLICDQDPQIRKMANEILEKCYEKS